MLNFFRCICVGKRARESARQHSQHTSALDATPYEGSGIEVNIRQHTSAYISIHQHIYIYIYIYICMYVYKRHDCTDAQTHTHTQLCVCCVGASMSLIIPVNYKICILQRAGRLYFVCEYVHIIPVYYNICVLQRAGRRRSCNTNRIE